MSDGNVTPLFPGRERGARERLAAAQDQVIVEGGDDAASEASADEEAVPAGKLRLPIRITRLEMRAAPTTAAPPPHGQRVGLLRLREVPTAFYRFLFDGVGREHHWRLPEDQTEAELHAWLNSPDCEVHVLYVGGAPAGFFEIDLSDRRRAVSLSCFGILPHARGRGLARWFLAEAVRAAWAHAPPRVRIQTNNHDSPIALRLYQAAGFEVTGVTQGYLIVEEER